LNQLCFLHEPIEFLGDDIRRALQRRDQYFLQFGQVIFGQRARDRVRLRAKRAEENHKYDREHSAGCALEREAGQHHGLTQKLNGQSAVN
jgi:hypothetical protein